MNIRKRQKQLKREIKDLRSQLKRLTYVSIALTLVLTGASAISACGAGVNFV